MTNRQKLNKTSDILRDQIQLVKIYRDNDMKSYSKAYTKLLGMLDIMELTHGIDRDAILDMVK